MTVLDPHFSPNTPASRKDDYREATAAAWKQTARFAKNANAQAIIIAGDLFHLLRSARNPYWFTNEVIDLFRETQEGGTEILAIAGNHDIPYGGSLNHMDDQPFGTLVKAGAIHLLDQGDVTIEATDGETKTTTRIAGRSYAHGTADQTKALTKQGADYLVAVGHFWYGPTSGDFFGEPVYGNDFLANGEPDIYVIGHHHEDQGTPSYDTAYGKRLYMVHGSMNRTGTNKHDLQRRPAVGLIEILPSGFTGKTARLKVPPAADIFDLEKKAQLDQEKKELEEFMGSLQNQTWEATSYKEIAAATITQADVRAKVDEYLDKAEAELYGEKA